MTLATAFAAHLTGPSPAATEALAAAGLETEVSLLRSYARGDREVDAGVLLPGWSGRRCTAGPQPPKDAEAGELWFDIGELTAMLLVPRPAEELAELPPHLRERLTPFVSWLSVAPAASWQLTGWADAVGRPDPATAGLSARDAADYAGYFGKAMANAGDWRALAQTFPKSVAEQLWAHPEPEFAGYVEEGVARVLPRDRALAGPAEDEDEDDFEDELVDEGSRLPGVRMRTHVSTQLGLLDTGRWPRSS